VALRQSYSRLAKKALRLTHRYAHARQLQRSRREIKRLKTYLGQVFRDSCPAVTRPRAAAGPGCPGSRRPPN
jgi:IS5 family transposase